MEERTAGRRMGRPYRRDMHAAPVDALASTSRAAGFTLDELDAEPERPALPT